jgi:pre-mRNA-splicing factor ISY1
MARNSEKAMTALARWRQLQLKEQGKLRVDRRPHLASEETNVKKAEKWRYQVVREIAKKVAQIQNGKNNIQYFLIITCIYFSRSW